MEYNFRGIEKKWQKKWKESDAYKVSNDSDKPKYYVLDMFPYPSGAGLHVGHPLGYIASDIYARYKRLKGFNVLHPMGYDAFGLPAEQYALEHGIHPAESTEKNIHNFRKQLDNIGFSFDWSRELRTSDPEYYKWTQWIFLQLFKSFFDRQTHKAESIDVLINSFEENGNKYHPLPNAQYAIQEFTAKEWQHYDEAQQQDILMQYRLAYCGYGEVNWCEALGTVLANDEVVNGVSERGGYPVEKKRLRQWYLRITEYADRLLEGLETVDFSEAMKEMQRNWIGKSYGAEIDFRILDSDDILKVYTTRPDTIFGVDFMVVAPEHEIIAKITTHKHEQEVEEYLAYVKSRSDRERMAEKTISGCFTGAYAINPLSLREVPVYISEYVLAGYGTGAIMGVPCGDQRDFNFAKHFGINITNIIGEHFNGEEANATKDAELTNSDFLTGMLMRDAAEVVITDLEGWGKGKRKVNYKMRDAAFSRQRYWGEPFPIVWKNGIAYPLDESELPLELPYVESYKPGAEGEGPLANVEEWIHLTPNPSPEERGTQNRQESRYKTNTAGQWEFLKNYGRENRQNSTEAEDALWQEIRNRKIEGNKFRRQHAIAGYIPDFVCLEKKWVIEIDGEYHDEKEQKKFDESRTNWLNEHGYKVLRFTNEHVLSQLSAVLENIKIALSETQNIGKGEDKALSFGEGLGEVARRESSTMPGYAGSSWYFLRYMDPHDDKAFCDKKISDYWGQVDLYVGGTEHAVGHLLYSRMWTKFLYDRGYISFDEPFKKLLNQGMIQGSSRFVYRLPFRFEVIENLKNLQNYEVEEDTGAPKIYKPVIFISNKIYQEVIKQSISNKTILQIDNTISEAQKLMKEKNIQGKIFFQNNTAQSLHVDVNLVDGVELDMEAFRKEKPQNKYAVFICEDGSINAPLSLGEGLGVRSSQVYVCGTETEKMSKSKLNTVSPYNPSDENDQSTVVVKYGADTFRMYEMFLGPVDQSKPWDTKGIEGVHRFLRKLWRLFYDEQKGKIWNNEKATKAELKVLHKAIKKIEEDTERFSFNTAVSAFMVCVNELTELNCSKKEILEPLVKMLTPYAPHIAEELYHDLNSDSQNNQSVLDAAYPKFDEKFLIESSKEYPVSVNGKLRTTINISLDASPNEVEKIVLENGTIKKWLEDKAVKRIIYIKGKMVNVVV